MSRTALVSWLRALGGLLIAILSELRDQAYLVLLIAAGVGLITREILPGAEWGAGMVVFGGLSLTLRRRGGERE